MAKRKAAVRAAAKAILPSTSAAETQLPEGKSVRRLSATIEIQYDRYVEDIGDESSLGGEVDSLVETIEGAIATHHAPHQFSATIRVMATRSSMTRPT